jgi:hypothetical protein
MEEQTVKSNLINILVCVKYVRYTWDGNIINGNLKFILVTGLKIKGKTVLRDQCFYSRLFFRKKTNFFLGVLLHPANPEAYSKEEQ